MTRDKQESLVQGDSGCADAKRFGANRASARQTRAAYERQRAFRHRAIVRKLRDVQGRMSLPAPDAAAAQFATFSMLYESADGRLCLFEDAQGHLSAVDSSKLA